MKLLSVGSLNIDHFYRVSEIVRPGETRHVSSRTIGSGGKGLNQSIAAARAGLVVCHVGNVGADGSSLVAQLADAGVDTSLVRVVEEATGHTIIQVNDAGQNCILVYGGANQTLARDQIADALDVLEPDDVVLLQNETNLVAETISMAADRGLRVAFNASPVDDTLGTFPLECVRWLFVNEVEGEALTGECAPEAILETLERRLPTTDIILTLGERGSVWAHDGVSEQRDALRVPVVDTTGAGDTFTGYFLRAVLAPLGGVSPLSLATVASACAIGRAGAADSIPTIDEVLASKLL